MLLSFLAKPSKVTSHDASRQMSLFILSPGLSKLQVDVITDFKQRLEEETVAARDREYRLKQKILDLTNQV